MKFTITTQEIETKRLVGKEPYDKSELDTEEKVKQWVTDTIRRFNATLRPHEKAREVISLEFEGVGESHNWVKTSMATVCGTHHYKGKMYDEYRCTQCGVTGKRFGLAQSVTIDPKYKRKHKKCSHTQVTK